MRGVLITALCVFFRIIPIVLVHRPSNAIPYATLEEELIGDFVKYSVKDGKEINLKRKDSEAGQKCCAFQHWVFTQTDGNLLVTDMQGEDWLGLVSDHLHMIHRSVSITLST